MSTIANAKVAHNYNRYNGYFFGCLLFLLYTPFVFIFSSKAKRRTSATSSACYQDPSL